MKNKFTWHKVSNEEKLEIEKESKKLLNNFASKIEKIKTKESHFSKDNGFREEGTGWETNEDFKSIMLDNAPFVDENFIIAEKGAWK